MARAKDPLKENISRIILQNIGNYIPGWLQTLGELGAPTKAGKKELVDGRTRVQAAKTGMDIVNKLLPDVGSSSGGEELLRRLRRAGQLTDTEPAAGGDRTILPVMEGEEADMEEDQEPDRWD